MSLSFAHHSAELLICTVLLVWQLFTCHILAVIFLVLTLFFLIFMNLVHKFTCAVRHRFIHAPFDIGNGISLLRCPKRADEIHGGVPLSQAFSFTG